ncbi:PD40 domain-containing protein [Candidatus Bipolaricaulota bacterium]|nr:PD40 domain-containing protein [Candidatus Bipolaricaulota bacterium]
MRAFCCAILIFGLAASAQVFHLSALDWSPDGTRLLLVTNFQLFLAEDESLRKLTPIYAETWTDWARFGSDEWFVFPSPLADGFGLWRGFLDGREPELLHRSEKPILWPTVSADGTKIAFVEDWNDLVILDLSRGEARTVLGGDWPKATPEFLPTGQALLFAGFWARDHEPNWEIFYLDLATLNLIQLTADLFFDWCPRISPDGLWIAFVSNRGGTGDIWIMPLFGDTPFPVTEDPWDDAFPAWSPDGSTLGYASFRLEGWEFRRTGTH